MLHGYQLEVMRHPVAVDLSIPERHSCILHTRISARLTRRILQDWTPQILKDLARLRQRVLREADETKIEAWEELVGSANIAALRRILTGLDPDAIGMRRVSPMCHLLTDD